MEAMKVILSIVERGQGAAMLKLYRKRQVPIHIQCAGKGTATSEIMDILGLGSSEKDILISTAAASAASALLDRLGPVLGRYDGDSQRLALEEGAAGLRALQGEAADERNRLGRVYGVLGVTAGLFAAIVLL